MRVCERGNLSDMNMFAIRLLLLLTCYATLSSNIVFVNSVNIEDADGLHVADNDTFLSTQRLNPIRISGLKVEKSEADWSLNDDTIPELIEKTRATLRLYGHGFTKDMTIMFVDAVSLCPETFNVEFAVQANELSEHSVLVEIIVPDASDQNYHICTKDNYVVKQGSSHWLVIKSKAISIPMWLTVVILAVCLGFSALFSGLNLGLMALDKTELKILINTGTKSEQKYAKIIQPVRNHGNFLLCSILLGNVLVNATNATVMGSLTTGLFAVLSSTFLIVIFGEVIPQAICSRHGLMVGARTILVTKFLMILTSPLAYPISRILDWVLGEELGNVYSRERLKELVRVTTDGNDLDKDEVNIISGALDMKKKTVAEVMTPIEDVFMLSYDAVLDFETISEIMKSGYSRIPVYEGSRHNVQKLLLIKDLALIDPDDNTPLRTLCEFYQNYCYFVFEDVTLAAVFRQFKTGQHGHMAFVRRITNDGGPICETIGLITLEDVIEELIQAEIMDETDIIDNRITTKLRTKLENTENYTAFGERREVQRIHITPQLASASLQYLSTCVEAFKPESISPTILQRLLKQDVIFQIKCKGKDKNDASLVIFEQGKPADYFILILEGRVEVTVGVIEALTFECGPFTFFGSDALSQNIGGVEPKDNNSNVRGSLQSVNLNALLKHSFEPDYTVKAMKDVLYIAIKRSLYLAAVRATLMERSQKIGDHDHAGIISHEEAIDDDDVKIFLNSLHEDYRTMKAKNDAIGALQSQRATKSASPSIEVTPIALENVVGDHDEPENQTARMMLPPHI